MKGTFWNTTEPMALTSNVGQCVDQQKQQETEERQQTLLSAATPAWGLVRNNSGINNTISTPNSPEENATLLQASYTNYNINIQASLKSTSLDYSSHESITVKVEPQEHPEYDSGRETLHDAEEDDMMEMSPEVFVQAELASESNDNSDVQKQAPKKPTQRKLLMCPVCNFESDSGNRDVFMNHLIKHCIAANREGPVIPGPSRSDEEQPIDEEAENDVIDDDVNLRTPQITAQGTVKFYRCKKCKTPTLTKYDSWIHQRTHMTPEKILFCKVCPFATEYKHHLEYHMRNHYGSKPFKCQKCNYTCVNKSMLNSHLKSHSAIYQYRCASCNYVTKYCHSLKVHLKRNMHKPAIVLNPDGTPNPNPIIDVNSSRRGPRAKPSTVTSGSNDNNLSEGGSSEYENQVALYPEVTYQQFGEETNSVNRLYYNGQFSNYQNFYSNQICKDLQQVYVQNQHANLNFVPNTEEQLKNLQKNLAVFGYMKIIQDLKAKNGQESTEKETENEPEKYSIPWSSNSEPLDLSNKSDSNSDGNSPVKRRRKGIAMKVENKTQNRDSDTENHDDAPIEIESVDGSEDGESNEIRGKILVYRKGIKQNMYVCRICDIMFRNEIMFTIHMGYHGRKDPLCCNICGEKCPDHLSFYVHVTRTEH